jgi:hypothetical protein
MRHQFKNLIYVKAVEKPVFVMKITDPVYKCKWLWRGVTLFDIQDVSRSIQTLRVCSTQQNNTWISYENASGKASFQSYSPESTVKALSSLIHSQMMLKMSSVRFSARLETYYWLSNTFKDVGGDAASVTAVHNALLESFYVVNKRLINKGIF